MRTLVNSDRLRALFEAHGARDDSAFERVAHAIISDELASNHHRSATNLQHALKGQQHVTEPAKAPDMRTIPKDRRHGEDLLLLHDSSVTAAQVVLVADTQARIQRVLDEHRTRHRLRAHGLRPKSKLLFWGPP